MSMQLSPLSAPVTARQAWHPCSDYQVVMPTPLPLRGARLGLRIEAGSLRAIDVLGNEVPERAPSDDVSSEIARQLSTYFGDPTWSFHLSLALKGTPYQLRVWQALREIPPGETLTYGDLAERVGGGARAVGSACRQNPVPIVVPCHRVVARNGLGGYMGEQEGTALAVKRWLLAHESARW